MRKSVQGLFVIAVVALVLAGCASFPAKVTSDDCLVVIRTQFVNPFNAPRGREITFKFSGNYPPSVVGQYSWDFNLVVVRENGVMLQSIGTSLQGGFRGPEWEGQANLPIPYQPGKIVIADYVFVDTITQTEEHRYSTSFGLRKITNEERDALQQMLDNDDRFASWRQ
jgi:hypothetical protein